MKASDLYFDVLEEDGSIIIAIVPITFWEKYHHMSDTEEYDELMEALGYYRMCECIYEPGNEEATIEEIKNSLLFAGLKQSVEFTTFNQNQ